MLSSNIRRIWKRTTKKLVYGMRHSEVSSTKKMMTCVGNGTKSSALITTSEARRLRLMESFHARKIFSQNNLHQRLDYPSAFSFFKLIALSAFGCFALHA